jgi:hypothetical protein
VSTDGSAPAGAPPAPPPANAELASLRESQDRALHMEGIPMLIGLADERGGAGPTVPAGDAVDPRHAAVLARIDHYRAVLAPSQRETDMGVIASVLTVAAYEDFDRIAAL